MMWKRRKKKEKQEREYNNSDHWEYNNSDHYDSCPALSVSSRDIIPFIVPLHKAMNYMWERDNGRIVSLFLKYANKAKLLDQNPNIVYFCCKEGYLKTAKKMLQYGFKFQSLVRSESTPEPQSQF